MVTSKDENEEKSTFGVSRGSSEKEARKRHHELKHTKRSSADKARIAKYDADSNQNYRLSRLEKDDAISTRLSGYQQRALEQRMNRKDKSTKAKLQISKVKRLEAAIASADAQVVLHTESPGFLETETEMERTTALTQAELKREHLDEQTSRQIFDLELPHSPYGCKYDRSGRYSVLYGKRGHLALMDSHNLKLHTEFHVQERVRDACFLHNFSMLAVAQANHVFIYDDTGAEIHKLDDHHDPFAVDFLPHHWLLTSVGRQGILRFQDTSTGQLVSQHKTKLGPCDLLRQNPSNAITHLGHHNGTVTLWSPSSSQYLVKLLCHKGAKVTSLAVDLSGRYMVTGGADRQVKVWDLRMLRNPHSYFVPAGTPTSLDISQKGVVGIGHAGHATFWSPDALSSKSKDPYMHHSMPACSPVETLRFRPFQDVCGIGHSKGISSIVVPGSGEPNLDTSEYNLDPFQDKRQRREAEVRALLDKLDPNTIALDPNEIGGVEESSAEVRQARLRDLEEEANARKKPKKVKQKKRGRSKIQTKLRRKRNNIIDEQSDKLREAREKEKQENGNEQRPDKPVDTAPVALKRFFS
jgi:U3 small nucleolar RNA-associated protein 7